MRQDGGSIISPASLTHIQDSRRLKSLSLMQSLNSIKNTALATIQMELWVPWDSRLLTQLKFLRISGVPSVSAYWTFTNVILYQDYLWAFIRVSKGSSRIFLAITRSFWKRKKYQRRNQMLGSVYRARLVALAVLVELNRCKEIKLKGVNYQQLLPVTPHKPQVSEQ